MCKACFQTQVCYWRKKPHLHQFTDNFPAPNFGTQETSIGQTHKTGTHDEGNTWLGRIRALRGKTSLYECKQRLIISSEKKRPNKQNVNTVRLNGLTINRNLFKKTLVSLLTFSCKQWFPTFLQICSLFNALVATLPNVWISWWKCWWGLHLRYQSRFA